MSKKAKNRDTILTKIYLLRRKSQLVTQKMIHPKKNKIKNKNLTMTLKKEIRNLKNVQKKIILTKTFIKGKNKKGLKLRF
jgi:hypothetical protein